MAIQSSSELLNYSCYERSFHTMLLKRAHYLNCLDQKNELAKYVAIAHESKDQLRDDRDSVMAHLVDA